MAESGGWIDAVMAFLKTLFSDPKVQKALAAIVERIVELILNAAGRRAAPA